MRMMFISQYFFQGAGAHALSMAHLDALIALLGREAILTAELMAPADRREGNAWQLPGHRGRIRYVGELLCMNPLGMPGANRSALLAAIRSEKVDTVFIDDSVYGKLARDIKRRCPEVRIVSFYHDVKRALYVQWMRRKPWLAPKLLGGLWGERLNCRYADTNIVLNERERRSFARHYGKDPEAILPIIVPPPRRADSVAAVPAPEGAFILLFVGSSYYPNREGVDWFVRHVMPLLPERACLWVVGQGMEAYRSRWDGPNVRVVGTVDDPAPYYERADAVVAPVFKGAGMKVKTAEAFSFGKAVIASQESLTGYEESLPKTLLGRFVFRADTKEAFAESIQTLMERPPKRHIEAVFALYQRFYSRDAAVCGFAEILGLPLPS